MSDISAPKPAGFLQPHPLTSVMQFTIAAASLCVAAAAIVYVVRSSSEERNARMVEIGVGVLRADPSKEGHVVAAREWALQLIDSNAGGVRFSKEARAALIQKPLEWRDSFSFDGFSPLRGPASISGGECKIFIPPDQVIQGKTQRDQDWIDETIAGGIAGCRWPRPKAVK